MSTTEVRNVNDLSPSHPDSNYGGKQELLEELRELKAKALSTEHSAEHINAELTKIDDEWDFGFWSGVNDVVELVIEITDAKNNLV